MDAVIIRFQDLMLGDDRVLVGVARPEKKRFVFNDLHVSE